MLVKILENNHNCFIVWELFFQFIHYESEFEQDPNSRYFPKKKRKDWNPKIVKNELSNGKKPGCVGHIGDSTTQLSGDYNKLSYGSQLANEYFMESKGPRFFFVAQFVWKQKFFQSFIVGGGCSRLEHSMVGPLKQTPKVSGNKLTQPMANLWTFGDYIFNTVDGWNPANQLMW